MPLRSVILPVAGRGTRLLPATTATPKELLPVYDTPLLSFALNEAVMAGVERIILVTHRNKPGIEAFAQYHQNEAPWLLAQSKRAEAAVLGTTEIPRTVDIHFVYQDEPLGLGHAVLCAAGLVLSGPIGVILPDDVMFEGTCLSNMADAYAGCAATSLVAAMEVAEEDTSSYGIFDLDPTEGATLPARGLVEKPSSCLAPSRLAAIGRYILPPQIFEKLQSTPPGAGGEVQLTDAIDAMGGLHAYKVTEDRYDCGSKDGLLDAGLAFRKRRLVAAASQLAAE